MNEETLSVREIQKEDIEPLLDYWFGASKEYFDGMGADISKLPSRANFTKMLEDQITLPSQKKSSYALIWFLNGHAIGHSNVNKIEFGQSAFMHLHLWQLQNRVKGLGSNFVRLSLPYFFKNLELKELFCEPYALNPAPNKTLAKLGFEFIKEYRTIPGSLNFEQNVKRWRLSKSQFDFLELLIPWC